MPQETEDRQIYRQIDNIQIKLGKDNIKILKNRVTDKIIFGIESKTDI